MFFVKERLGLNTAIADWCLRKAGRCRTRRQTEAALQWLHLAAWVMSRECSALASPELEECLISIGREFECPAPVSVRSGSSTRWLHILTEVREDGGHSAMLKRWIQLDPGNTSHSVALLAQTVPVPVSLTDTVSSRQGRIHTLDHRETILSRSQMLQELVAAHADVVVLHTHPWDIIPTVALALPGGAPVLLVNHAAHIFWVGAAVSDVVLDCRVSPQEDRWTSKHRGVPSIMHLPIPLPLPVSASSQEAGVARSSIRDRFGIPLDAPVMLSVGIGNKYTSFEGTDFKEVMADVLDADRQAFLLVVGPTDDAGWERLRQRSGGRCILVEKQPHDAMPAFHHAADIYVEGFPFGSTTALLEAALTGLPCVLPPPACPPPFTTDGVALENLVRAEDLPAYRQHIHLLLNDPEERRRCGSMLSESVRSHHCGAGWSRYLEEIQAGLPPVHGVRALQRQQEVEPALSAYWSSFSAMINEDPLAYTYRTARSLGLSPRIDPPLLWHLIRYRRGRGSKSPSIRSLLSESCGSCMKGAFKRGGRLARAGWQGATQIFSGVGVTK